MGTTERVMIVEDEVHALHGLAELVSSWGYETEMAADGLEALEKLPGWQPGIIVTDLKMPRMNGLELLQQLQAMKQDCTVVVLTAQGSIELAVEAMKIGAYDFIQKPVEPNRLRTTLSNATHMRETERQLEVTRRKLRDTGILGPLVGSSRKMRDIFSLIEQVAPSNVSVLITGESGTGKELVARALHELSPRKPKPFVAVNCAAIPETLIESEIFGHEKGAFTGAMERRAGCFELAEEGTLLLDEIGEMPVATQAKLLRVLEDRKLRRLGSKLESSVDVRVLAATNKNPEAAVDSGHLRPDLYYRLNVFNIHMPPLRDHKEDIPAIVEAMVQDMNNKHGRQVPGVDPGMLQRLMQYDWPGNVRELRNTIERAVILWRQQSRERTAPAAGLRQPWHRLRIGKRGRQHGEGGSGHHGRRGGAPADREDPRLDQQQQDPGGGNPRHQPQDAAQQAEGVQPEPSAASRRPGAGTQRD